MKRLAIICSALLLAAPAAAEFPQAQKNQVATRLVNSLERAKNVMLQMSQGARFHPGKGGRLRDVHNKVGDGWTNAYNALTWLLDMDRKLAIPRETLQANAFAQMDMALIAWRAVTPMLDQLVSECTPNCQNLQTAKANLAAAIDALAKFDRSLDYTMDPKVEVVQRFPDTTRSSAALNPPHGDWDTLGGAAASMGRNAITSAQKAMDALARDESMAAFEARREHSIAEGAWIAAKAIPLTVGIEYGNLKEHTDIIFSGFAEVRDRHFARGVLFFEMMYATAWDDSQFDFNGRKHHRGIAYLWTQECLNNLAILKATPGMTPAALDLVSALNWLCEGWKDSDSAGWNGIVFRDFNAGGRGEIDCERLCGTTPNPEPESCPELYPLSFIFNGVEEGYSCKSR